MCHRLDRLRTLETPQKFPSFTIRREPLFITKNSYGDLAVMSIEAYEEMIETVRIDAAISEVETQYAADGVLLDATGALSSLRKKHF